jgi:hypothetical protein
MWDMLSPKGEGYLSYIGTPGVQPKTWVTMSPKGEDRLIWGTLRF